MSIIELFVESFDGTRRKPTLNDNDTIRITGYNVITEQFWDEKTNRPIHRKLFYKIGDWYLATAKDWEGTDYLPHRFPQPAQYPTFTEQNEIPRPTCKNEVEWNRLRNRWEKYTKTKGWIAA